VAVQSFDGLPRGTGKAQDRPPKTATEAREDEAWRTWYITLI
jgi:hypothetical protein